MQTIEILSVILFILFFLSLVFDSFAEEFNKCKFHLISAVCSFLFILVSLYFFD